MSFSLRHASLTQDWAVVSSDCANIGTLKHNKGDFKRYGYKVNKLKTNFFTKSSYEGQWDSLGFSGYGTYIYPHGVKYEGFFSDGEFHGSGVLIYPSGQEVEGRWRYGKLLTDTATMKFASKMQYTQPWKYCEMPDRRFQVEFENGLNPAGNEYLTNLQPTPVIPPNCYDEGSGFYHPQRGILSYEKPEQVIKMVDEEDDDEETKFLEPKKSAVYSFARGAINFGNKISQNIDETFEKSLANRTDSIVLRQDSNQKGIDRNISKKLVSKCGLDVKSLTNQKGLNPKISVPHLTKEGWIKKYCRKGWDEPVEYCPALYENWTTGLRDEIDYIQCNMPSD